MIKSFANLKKAHFKNKILKYSKNIDPVFHKPFARMIIFSYYSIVKVTWTSNKDLFFYILISKHKLFNIEFTKTLLLLETNRRPIGDKLETHQRQTCLIGDSSETVMSDQRPTCLIRDQPVWSEIRQRLSCFIWDPSETDMPHQRPTCLSRDPSKTDRNVGLW